MLNIFLFSTQKKRGISYIYIKMDLEDTLNYNRKHDILSDIAVDW